MLISALIATAVQAITLLGSPSFIPQSCPNQLYNPTSNLCSQCLSSSISGRNTICNCRVGINSPNCGSISCSGGQIRSKDGTFCINCPGATTQIIVNGTTQTICDCPTGEYYSDRDAGGTNLGTATCQACPAGFYPATNRTTCIACSDPSNMAATFTNGAYSCQCNTNSGFSQTPIAGQCILNSVLTPITSAYGSASKQISISMESTTIQLTPDFINNNLIYSLSSCSDGNLQACELMANICVMSMYNKNHPACSAHLAWAEDSTRVSILGDPYQNQPLGLPWIFWTTKLRETAKQTRDRQPALTVPAGKVPCLTGLAKCINISVRCL